MEDQPVHFRLAAFNSSARSGPVVVPNGDDKAGFNQLSFELQVGGGFSQGAEFIVLDGFHLSLLALQLLYFHLSQFMALTATLAQVALLFVSLAYRRWHLHAQPQ